MKLEANPVYIDYELALKDSRSISLDQLKRAYDYYGKVGGTIIYRQKGDISPFLAGTLLSDRFEIATRIVTRDGKAYPVKPSKIGPHFYQVSFVETFRGYEEAGIAKSSYELIAKSTPLVSDHEQYLGGRVLWNSLAKSSKINVYVFDGNHSDYVRDLHGNLIKYNGSNINPNEIWGSSITYSKILLVGTARNLT